MDEVVIGHDPLSSAAFSRARALNDAAARAQGQLFFLADADQVPDPEAISFGVARTVHYPFVRLHDQVTRASRASTEQILQDSGAALRSAIWHDVDDSPHSALAVTRAAFIRTGGLDEEHPDGEFLDQLLAAHRGSHTDRVIYCGNALRKLWTTDEQLRSATPNRVPGRVSDQVQGWVRQPGSDALARRRAAGEVIITSLLTGTPDPQRTVAWEPDVTVLDELRGSLSNLGHGLTVLADELAPTSEPDLTIAEVTPPTCNPYFQRHLSAYRYLAENPWISFAWCVDGSDVEMFRDPFPEMEPGRLYLGYEPEILDTPWMRQNHPAPFIQKILDDHGQQRLLNAGLIGGDRTTMLRFLGAMAEEITPRLPTATDGVRGRGGGGRSVGNLGVGDMGLLNAVARRPEFNEILVTGPRVCTLFKSYQTPEQAPAAWWAHK